MAGSKKELFFTHRLLRWDKEENLREMPWKGEKDPYRIWLSEIILQQTRVEQGLAYYNKFIKKYPAINNLAHAPEKDVFKLWEGLGYYSRCKNLIATAKYISLELKGKFPSDYESILQQRGIGPYTAAAIASFAFNLPHAVVDGNVMRVLARFFGIATAIDSHEGKKSFVELAGTLLKKDAAAVYNQAIMDFGATVCKPRLPLCSQCILADKCIAYIQGAVNEYPVKSKKLTKKHRWFYYLLAENNGGFLVRKRETKDIWQNLHEFFLLEAGMQLSLEEIIALPEFKKVAGEKAALIHVSKTYKQQLTHQTIHGSFVHIKLKNRVHAEGYISHTKAAFFKLAFPKFITAYFKERPDFFNTKV